MLSPARSTLLSSDITHRSFGVNRWIRREERIGYMLSNREPGRPAADQRKSSSSSILLHSGGAAAIASFRLDQPQPAIVPPVENPEPAGLGIGEHQERMALLVHDQGGVFGGHRFVRRGA